MMFCRYCGVQIPDDSVFCSKCGKRLDRTAPSGLSRILFSLHFKTPYPYFAILLIAFLAWAVFGLRQTRADYSHTKWGIELDRKLDLPADHLFQQSMSLVLENTGPTAIREVPVAIAAKIEPRKPAQVVAGLGTSASALRKLVILDAGRPLPLDVVLSDTVQPGGKRRYYFEGSIQAEPPFRVTYEVRQRDSSTVLASYVVEQ